MKRILKFVLIFIVVTVALLGSIIWFGWDAFRTLHENRSGMAEGSEWIEDTYSMSGLVHYIGSNDHYVSLQNLTLEVSGSDDPSHNEQEQNVLEYSLQLNTATPRAAGLVSSLYLLTAYAEGFSTGELDSTSIIDLNQLSSWQLPGVHEQAHKSLLEIAAAVYPDLQVPLSVLVSWLPVSSDLSLHDFLLDYIGNEKIIQLYETAGLEQTEAPVPYSGLYLLSSEWLDGSMAGFSEGALTLQKQEGLDSEEDRAWVHQYAWKRAREFHAGGPEVDTWKKALKEDRLGLTFMQERDALELFPRTSASDLSRFTERLFTGNLVSEPAADQVFTWLSWAGLRTEVRLSSANGILQSGSLYDSRMGLLSGLHLVRVREDFGEKEKIMIQSAIFESLPVGLWFHLSANHMHQDFLQRLLSDSTLMNQTQQMINSLELISP